MDNTSGSEQNARQYSSHNQSAQGYSNKYSFASSNSPSPALPPLPSKPFPIYSYVRKVEEQQPLTFKQYPIVRFQHSHNSPVSKLNTFSSKDLLKPSSPIKYKALAETVKNIPQEPVNTKPFQAQRAGHKIERLSRLDKDKKVVAIIVSFCNGQSYDNIFTTVQQKTLQGTQVLVYTCGQNAIESLMKAFNGENNLSRFAQEIVHYTKQIDPDCVLFNWQCCSFYGEEAFYNREQTMNFLGYVISKGFMTMFSDFSLKALINDWDESILGKNPFKRLGSIAGPVTLRFQPQVLKGCPSTQLQLLGDLAEKGQCTMNCDINTILYAVDKRCIDNEAYTVQVLTIRSTNDFIPKRYMQNIEGKQGDAGHVLLRYKSGGMILTSMGHWLELMKIDTSEKKFFQAAQRYYGLTQSQTMKSEYMQLSQVERSSYLVQKSVVFMKNQSPCQTMIRKTCIY